MSIANTARQRCVQTTRSQQKNRMTRARSFVYMHLKYMQGNDRRCCFGTEYINSLDVRFVSRVHGTRRQPSTRGDYLLRQVPCTVSAVSVPLHRCDSRCTHESWISMYSRVVNLDRDLLARDGEFKCRDGPVDDLDDVLSLQASERTPNRVDLGSSIERLPNRVKDAYYGL